MNDRDEVNIENWWQ